MIVTIDGPASVGKATLTKKIVEKFGLRRFDTGMLYRAVGLEMLLGGLDPANEDEAFGVAAKMTYKKMMELSKFEDFDSMENGKRASVVAHHNKVREALLGMQRDFANGEGDVVYEGRDIGTVVCPMAELKIFLTADTEVRAHRKYKKLISKGVDVSFEDVLEDVKMRDERDVNRSIAPLIPAPDAIVIDTSYMTVDGVFEEVSKLIEERIGQ